MNNPVTLDRYQLLGELGQGSFGIVYLAYDPKLEREVAVKLVKPEIANDPEVKLRFRREWKAIGRLRHPSIIELLDYADGEWMYLVTERLRGKTLLQLAQENLEPFSPLVAAAIVHEVALALEHAHEQGIVHRDVKPENIFLEPNGRIVLCDFGIAFAAHADADTTMRGRNTQLLGSPLYMSPEQVASDGGVGPPSDLFSLGAVAYFLAVGREAFLESSVLGVLKRIQAGQYHPFPPALVGTPYAAAVAKLLQADVKDRFADAAAVADAFLAVLKTGGQGDPRRLLKQQLAGFAQMKTATASRAPKPLEAVEGDSKTYITKLLSTDQRTPTVTVGLSQTAVSTGAMHQTSAGRSSSGMQIAIIGAVVLAVAGAAGAYAIMTTKPAKPVVVDPPPPRPGPDLPPPPHIDTPRQLPGEAPEPPPPTPKRPDRPAKETPPTVTAAKAKGILRVLVSPWGEVFVDGVRMGVTPEVKDLTLTEGPHQVRIVNKDFVAQERTVTVQPNDTVKLRVELQ